MCRSHTTVAHNLTISRTTFVLGRVHLWHIRIMFSVLMYNSHILIIHNVMLSQRVTIRLLNSPIVASSVCFITARKRTPSSRDPKPMAKGAYKAVRLLVRQSNHDSEDPGSNPQFFIFFILFYFLFIYFFHHEQYMFLPHCTCVMALALMTIWTHVHCSYFVPYEET